MDIWLWASIKDCFIALHYITLQCIVSYCIVLLCVGPVWVYYYIIIIISKIELKI